MSSKIGDVKIWKEKKYIKTLKGWRPLSKKLQDSTRPLSAIRENSGYYSTVLRFLEMNDGDFNAISENDKVYDAYKNLTEDERMGLFEEIHFTGCVYFIDFYDNKEPYAMYPVEQDYIRGFIEDYNLDSRETRFVMNEDEDLRWAAGGDEKHYSFYWIKAKKYLKEMCYQVGAMYLENGHVKIK